MDTHCGVRPPSASEKHAFLSRPPRARHTHSPPPKRSLAVSALASHLHGHAICTLPVLRHREVSDLTKPSSVLLP